MRVKCLLRGGAAVALLLLSNLGNATTVVGDRTELTLSAAPLFALAGLEIAELGNATLSNSVDNVPIATLPITGGTRDLATGVSILEHAGSGLRFRFQDTTLALNDLLVDTGSAEVSGNIEVFALSERTSDLGRVALFDLVDDIFLEVSRSGARAFSEQFGVGDFTGLRLGEAEFVVQVVPLPAAAWMFAAALAVLVTRRRAGSRR